MTDLSRQSKREQTREHIFETALGLIRRKGFDGTTMRAIALEAGMSLGAAYYHFPSKDALVLAYYERVSQARRRQAREAFAKTDDLRERLGAVFRIHHEQLRGDQKLLGALVRSVADPNSELSVFSETTRGLRNASIALFDEALSVDEVPEHLRDLAALGFWTFDLAMTLYFTWDQSLEQKKTLALINGSLDALMPLLPLLALPMAEPMLGKLAKLLIEADLVPEE